MTVPVIVAPDREVNVPLTPCMTVPVIVAPDTVVLPIMVTPETMAAPRVPETVTPLVVAR